MYRPFWKRCCSQLLSAASSQWQRVLDIVEQFFFHFEPNTQAEFAFTIVRPPNSLSGARFLLNYFFKANKTILCRRRRGQISVHTGSISSVFVRSDSRRDATSYLRRTLARGSQRNTRDTKLARCTTQHSKQANCMPSRHAAFSASYAFQFPAVSTHKAHINSRKSACASSWPPSTDTLTASGCVLCVCRVH